MLIPYTYCSCFGKCAIIAVKGWVINSSQPRFSQRGPKHLALPWQPLIAAGPSKAIQITRLDVSSDVIGICMHCFQWRILPLLCSVRLTCDIQTYTHQTGPWWVNMLIICVFWKCRVDLGGCCLRVLFILSGIHHAMCKNSVCQSLWTRQWIQSFNRKRKKMNLSIHAWTLVCPTRITLITWGVGWVHLLNIWNGICKNCKRLSVRRVRYRMTHALWTL